MLLKRKIPIAYRIVMIVLIILGSLLITNKVREQFPSINIESSLEKSATLVLNETMFVTRDDVADLTSNLHSYCSNKYKDSLARMKIYTLDESSVRIGDPILIISNIKNKGENLDFEVFSGTKKDHLIKVNSGVTDLGLVYYNGKNITTYVVVCLNLEDLNRVKSTIEFTNNFIRPSFIDSKTGFIVVFMTIFVLLSQFFDQIIKVFK